MKRMATMKVFRAEGRGRWWEMQYFSRVRNPVASKPRRKEVRYFMRVGRCCWGQ